MTGTASSCGACKFLRKKCTEGCVFAPYFSYDQGATHFAAVHKVFGASNVSKHLSRLSVQQRCDAALTMSYEAQARLRDPVYGCVSDIFALQHQVASLKEEIEILGKLLARAALDDRWQSTLSSEGLLDCVQVFMQDNAFADRAMLNATSLNCVREETKVEEVCSVYRDTF
ncbi:LOB domain-containing protein 29-like [Wolffia australiana]